MLKVWSVHSASTQGDDNARSAAAEGATQERNAISTPPRVGAAIVGCIGIEPRGDDLVRDPMTARRAWVIPSSAVPAIRLHRLRASWARRGPK
jgi:hypothetical protein